MFLFLVFFSRFLLRASCYLIVIRRSLFGVRCLLFVAVRSLFFVVRCLLLNVCCSCFFVVYCLLLLLVVLWYVGFSLLFVVC